MEAALERLLNKDSKPAELAHVDMKSRLSEADLVHVMELPDLWPPSLAVCFSYICHELLVRVVSRCYLGRRVSWQPR